MSAITNTPLTLSWVEPDITEILAVYNRLAWYRSRDGEHGLYEPASALAAQGAVLTGTMAEPHDVGGRELILEVDGAEITIPFAGASPYTTAAVIADIASAVAGVVVATEDADTYLVLTTATTGSAATLKVVGGDAAPYLGLAAADDQAVGLDAHVVLVSGESQYFFTDDNGSDEFWYKTQYVNSVTSPVSRLSVPITGDIHQVVDYDSTSVMYVKLSDVRGRSLPGRIVTIATSFQPNLTGGYAVFRHLEKITTDINGYAEIRLLRGALIDVGIDGTGFFRRFTVPDVTTFDLFDPALVVSDEFGIADLQVAYGIRTS